MITRRPTSYTRQFKRVSLSLSLPSTCCTSLVTIRETRSIDFALALKQWDFIAVHVDIPSWDRSPLFFGMFAWYQTVSLFLNFASISTLLANYKFLIILKEKRTSETKYYLFLFFVFISSIIISQNDTNMFVVIFNVFRPLKEFFYVLGVESWDFWKNYSACNFITYLDDFREDRDDSLSDACRRFFRRRQCPRSEGQLERRERVGVRRSSSYIKSWRGHFPKSVLRWTLSQETLHRWLFFHRFIEQHVIISSSTLLWRYPCERCLFLDTIKCKEKEENKR